MVRFRVLYFLEDIAHEKFLRALVTRVAGAQGIPSEQMVHEVRNAVGGKGKALAEFSQFVREERTSGDILVVAIDANCRRYVERRKEILRYLQPEKAWQVVCAIPDPHIERWYLGDPSAISKVFGLETPLGVSLPRYKCDRDWYKNALRKAIENAGFIPQLGGAEYGQEIAEAMDLYQVGKEDRAFKHFIDDLTQVLTRLKER